MTDHIADLIAAGRTDAQIVAALVPSGLTLRNTPVATVRNLFTVEWELLTPDLVTGANSGPLVTLFNAGTTSAPNKKAVSQLYARFREQAPADLLTADNAGHAAFWKWLVAALNLSPERRAVLDGLNGGERYATLTAAQVGERRAKLTTDTARVRTRQRNEHAVGFAINAVDAGKPDADVRAAFLNAFDSWTGV